MTPVTNGWFKSNLKKAKSSFAFTKPPVCECHSRFAKRKATLILDISKVPIEEEKQFIWFSHTTLQFTKGMPDNHLFQRSKSSLSVTSEQIRSPLNANC